jgi:hypothetical protein
MVEKGSRRLMIIVGNICGIYCIFGVFGYLRLLQDEVFD